MTTDRAIAQTDTNNTPDANALQEQASFPGASSWVGASAGTGKTKVLTDRVLRLLLPRPDGRPATDPARILCLTFTKAAAAEMAIRVNETLSKWAVMPEDKLDKTLEDLTGMTPDDNLRRAARRLFAQVIDVPGGLKIMTIHAFCQSVLARFPLEAGIAPNFEILDDALAEELMTAARDTILKERFLDEENKSDAFRAIEYLAMLQSESQLSDQLKSLNSERAQLLSLYETYPDGPSLWTAIAKDFDVPENARSDDAIEAFCRYQVIPENKLWAMAKAFHDGSDTDQQRGMDLQAWLENDTIGKMQNWPDFKLIFLTTKGKVRDATKGTLGHADHIDALHSEIGEAIQAVENAENALQSATATYHLLTLGRAVQDHYAKAKAYRGVLDYEDLIRLTRDLLAGKTTDITGENPSAWVLYKLDGGLDHILIDEAQDTNPEQWEIIDLLSQDFFSGETARSEQDGEILRTIFVVGDEKQSIFSFQRADPDKFHEMRSYFHEKIESASLEFRPVQMNKSFRSTNPVMRMVNSIFDSEQGKRDLGLKDNPDITHFAHRSDMAGRIDLWPLFEPEDDDDQDPWALPLVTNTGESPKTKLCKTVAERIQKMLAGEEILPSKNRPVQPKDIMILLRRRKDFAAPLIKELKSRNVEVSGLDRMVLSKELVVEDMLALADFALLPEDDLSLACILRSPLIGMLEEEPLYKLAHGRKGKSLWSVLRQSEHTEIVDYLEKLIIRAGDLRPYDFFAGLLHSPCPADPEGSALRAIQKRLGHDALDPLEEFLNACINYEREEIPTLQGFSHWQRDNSTEIKREQEEAADQVRIMTVHGSKGLQAPIVFLPDTVLTGQGGSSFKPSLLWPNRTGYNVPLWAPNAEMRFEIFSSAQDNVQDYLKKEYQRLLYVALTRAEDHLIVCGAKPKGTLSEDCWYEKCRAAFAGYEDARPHHFRIHTGENLEYQSITSDQIGPPKADDTVDQGIDDTPLPDWVNLMAEREPDPPRPLTPSRPSMPDQPTASPKKMKEDDYRFQRGRLTHKLLEYLPDLPESKWESAARTYLSTAESDLSGEILDSIWQETKALLNDPDFKAIFGPGSQAEVSISGLSGKTTLVSGQIDRLLIDKDQVLIVDYKTNRPPPQTPEEVPEIYLHQLRSYRDILAQIYPDKQIKSALIWTDGPRLMDLTANLDVSGSGRG